MPSTPKIVERPDQPYLGITKNVTTQTIGAVLPPLVGEVFGWLDARGVRPAAAPFFRYHVIDMEREMEVEVGVPVAAPVTGDDRVRAGVLPAGRYAVVHHLGRYEGLYDATARLLRWGDEHGLKWDMTQTGSSERWGARIEFYDTDPQEEPDPDRWLTELVFRLAS
jgi:effector-binding domain-containing protein